ncbi:C6 finger domain protein [Aspergillus neoniger CBS 115656]|uniref:C6 finger domain protein n=1 Tax=Aspergillus neoniger (strain CBS 115656) TaxID=1448310 RepID=A0A318YQA7_ASPNB|nr:C6 finger domain protein [Aspergillus neoniger CBS 115656]PYH34260.1 C6 finger domain protein [Aspergillus neoniger CBS 115656]
MAQQGSGKPFRPIAPRRIPEPPTPAAAPEEGKIKRASTACGECKRRRTKFFYLLTLSALTWLAVSQCSADTTGTPCAECALHDRECVIDEFADKRRKVAAKRAQEDLKYYRGFVEQLLEALRSGDRSTIDGILDVIRSGATHDEIRAVLARSAPKDEINIIDGVDSVATDGNNSTPASSRPDGLPDDEK